MPAGKREAEFVGHKTNLPVSRRACCATGTQVLEKSDEIGEIKSMKIFWRRAKPFVLGALCVFAALYLSPLNVIVGYAISTHDIAPIWATLFDPHASIMQFLLGLLLTLVAFVIALAGAVEACQNRQRPPIRFYPAILFCLVIVSPWIYLRSQLNSLWPTRRAGLEAAVTRAKPLIAAIERYKADEGHAPENLQALVPKYIARVPQTGMVSYPDFRYSRDNWGDSALQYYTVRVFTGFALSYESLNYASDKNYSSGLYSGRVERLGDWAYVHKSVLDKE